MKAFPACIKIFLKTVLWAAAVAVALVLVFLAVGVMTDFRPGGREPVYEYAGKWLCGSSVGYSGVAVPESRKIIPDTLKIVTWNIGYGGLGDDMDFFYDGGTRMRCSEERTRENLAAIVCELKSMDADIYLLQEVDEASRRSYMINELELLREAFPDYCLYFAYNYKSFFCPHTSFQSVGQGVERCRDTEQIPSREGGTAFLSFPFSLSCQHVQSETLPAGRRVSPS